MSPARRSAVGLTQSAASHALARLREQLADPRAVVGIRHPRVVLDCLDAVAPQGKWRHDRVDHNGAAHIQAGIVGPSESIPIRAGKLALSTWQNVFLCDFDGPRPRRTILVTIVGT